MYNKLLNAENVEKVKNMDGKSVELNDGNFELKASCGNLQGYQILQAMAFVGPD